MPRPLARRVTRGDLCRRAGRLKGSFTRACRVRANRTKCLLTDTAVLNFGARGRHTMSTGQFRESELRAQIERLREELDRARLAAQGAEARIRALLRERDRLARMNQALSQRQDTQSRFATSIAHDLNNVLAVITSGLELLARADQPERRARLIGRLEEAAWRRGGELTRRLAAFARQSGETAPIEDRSAEESPLSVLVPRAAGLPEMREHLSVLIVEDDDEMASLVADMLERLGHRGVRVSTLAAAVAVLSGGEAVDLIFADVLLAGGGSGLDLAREVGRRQLGLPIVLTSGFGSGMRGRLAAAQLPFLPKPYTLAALEQVLQQAARPPLARGMATPS